MKKFVKVILILAGVFGIIGLGLSVGGAAMGATLEDVVTNEKMNRIIRNVRVFDIDDMDVWEEIEEWDEADDWDETDEWDEEDSHHGEEDSHSLDTAGTGRSYSFAADQISEAEIELFADTLILQTHEENTFQVEVKNDSAQKINVDVRDRELRIQGSGKDTGRSVLLICPSGTELDKLEIQIDAGQARAEAPLSVRELDVKVGAGEFLLDCAADVKVREVEIEVGMGTAKIRGLAADKVKGECGVGSLSLGLAGKETDYSYELECGVGTISVGGEEYTAFAGKKHVNTPGASGVIELECGMGEISVEFEG